MSVDQGFLALKEHLSDGVLEAVRSKIDEETSGMTVLERKAFLKGLNLASCTTTMTLAFGKSVITECLSALVVAASEGLETNSAAAKAALLKNEDGLD